MNSSRQRDPVSAVAIGVNGALASGDSAALQALITTAAELYDRMPVAIGRAGLAFSRANAHSALRQLAAERHPEVAWEWDAPQLKQEIYWLRKALADVMEAKEVPAKFDLRLRIETNLGNAISHVGRFCEALEHWDAAISINPSFGMALACRGDGLIWYGRSLYESGHRPLFFYARVSRWLQG